MIETPHECEQQELYNLLTAAGYSVGWDVDGDVCWPQPRNNFVWIVSAVFGPDDERVGFASTPREAFGLIRDNYPLPADAPRPAPVPPTTPAPGGLAQRLAALVADITLPAAYTLHVGTPGPYLQVQCTRPDTYTGVVGVGHGGKAYPSEHATDSELVQCAWGLFKAYVEHEARESFQWRGRRVFGPHISTEALWEVAERLDVRPPQPNHTPRTP